MLQHTTTLIPSICPLRRDHSTSPTQLPMPDKQLVQPILEPVRDQELAVPERHLGRCRGRNPPQPPTEPVHVRIDREAGHPQAEQNDTGGSLDAYARVPHQLFHRLPRCLTVEVVERQRLPVRPDHVEDLLHVGGLGVCKPGVLDGLCELRDGAGADFLPVYAALSDSSSNGTVLVHE